MKQTPITTWQTTKNRSFYIDLGRFESINSVYFLVKIGSADLTVYTGSPGNWSYIGMLNIPRTRALSYYRWNDFKINSETRYVRFDFQQASIEIAEMAVLSLDNQESCD